MDFMWVSDIHNTRKQTCNAATANRMDMDQSEKPSRGTRLSNETVPVGRTRAGTMPSSTLPPFLGSPSLYLAQQRPNLTNRADPLVTNSNEQDDLYMHSGMSSPLDENATHSIASTLASLGLNEDAHEQSYFQPTMTRHRAFTISSRTMADQKRPSDIMSFSPFLQPKEKPAQRPRAISLGMMDSLLVPSAPPQQQQEPGFLPFDTMSYGHASSDYQNLVGATTKSSLTDDQGSTLPMYSMYTHDENMESPAQTSSRALWLGNINPSLSVPDLHKMFAIYGHVESARILSDKECAFVNFENAESALAAKEDLVNRLGSKVGGSVVKVGFGKADVNIAMALTNEAGPNAQGPTRALWVGNIPANMNPAVLRSIFQSFGSIESIRILSHKNCGFVNFERQEDAVRARKQMQNKEILGPGTGTVRVGFAKAPTNNPGEVIEDVVISGNTVTSYATPATTAAAAAKAAAAKAAANKTASTSINPSPSSSSASINEQTTSNDTTQWATVILMASMMMNAQKQQQQSNGATTPGLSNTTSSSSSSANLVANNYARLASERMMIMQQLGYEVKSDEVERTPINYFSSIPAVPEFTSDRVLGPSRLREIRKALDNGHAIPNIESIAQECMEEIVELCSDYIGNTVVQKLFEHCTEETKLGMIERIAPHLASIGVHKNGTWAAQKIIDTAHTDAQIQLICLNIAPYVPLLLLDQFGNYVVQCCLKMGSEYNQYIFDAIVDKCWDIGQGRFGARAVRAILENPIVTKDQQIYVAAAIMQNALLLTTNANGSILLNWLLDTSGLLGHFRALCNPN